MSNKTLHYTAKAGDAFDSIALTMYNEERMAALLITANPQYCDVLLFEGGEGLQIPIVEAVRTPDTLPPWRR